jgi:ligand-binding sensor domain-containing protein/signal transduction histidine kinase/DNA-binding response OmpR family regulator
MKKIKNNGIIIMKKVTFIIIMLCLFKSFSQSQVSFRQLSVKQGLSQNSVVSIAQDSTGYLWIATQDGLNRYDGNKIEIYNHFFIDITKPTYSHLGKVYVDRESNIWILPISKIPYIYNKISNIFLPFDDLSDVSVIYQDKKKNFWFGTYNSGLYKKEYATDKVTLIIKPKQINTIFSITEDAKGEIWMTSAGKIVSLNPENSKFKEYFPDNNPNSIINYSDLLFDNQENLWVGTYGNGIWIKKYDEKYFKKADSFTLQINNIPNDLYVLSMYLDKKNRLWIGTYGTGLYKINLKTFEANHYEVEKHNPRSIHYNDILSIYEDYSGTLWFGTDGAGVSYYDEYLEKFNSITNFQTPEKISIDLVRAITIDNNNNNVWIGTSGKGLTKYSPESNSWKTYLNKENGLGLSSNRVVSLFVDGENEIWIGTQDGGLNIMNANEKVIHFNKNTPVPLDAATIWNIFKDDNNRIWLGTRDHGLIQFDKHKGVIKSYEKSDIEGGLTSNNIRVVIQGEENMLWIGTDEDGVVLFNTKTETFIDFKKEFNNKNSILGNKIKSLFYDKKGILWAGTSGDGMNAYDLKNKIIYNYTTNDGLANNVIYGILPDSENNLWLSSNRGITMFSPPLNFKDKPQIINYDNYDGLATEFNTGAYFKAVNNSLYFGGLEGFYWFDPSQIEKNKVLPKTVITEFDVFNKPFPLVQKTVLKNYQNTISFAFSSLQFSLPKKNEYQYKLENHDENWVSSGNKNYVRYTNLPSGDYTFLVKSSNYDGVWNEEPAFFNFSVLKPWYLSNWMLFVYFILGIIGAIIPYYYLKWRWKMELNLKLEKEESERLKHLDEYKTKLYANLAHEFKTPLTLISAPLKKHLQNNSLQLETKNDLQLMERNASQLLGLVDQLLELSKLESGIKNLQIKKGDLALLLKSVSESFKLLAIQNHLQFSVKIPKIDNAWFDMDVLEKIVNNLLSNAIKYTSKNGSISLEVFQTSNEAVTMIFTNDINEVKERDTSKIFNRFYQEDTNSEGSGIGLSLVKELTNLTHGSIEASYFGNTKISFTVKIPISKDKFSPSEIDPKKSDDEDFESEILNVNTHENANQPIALVVDNNKDMRKFIKSLLIENYKVIEAKNGLEGIEKAIKTIPDIIISDIMMPIKNGIELCEALKQDEKTSHIPIILITAKTGEENEIIGLNTGADDYITKPFNPKKLTIRVQKLIELRKKLRARYKQDLDLSPNDIAITSTDEKFLNRIQILFNAHLTDPSFNAESFSKNVGMSRMQLHRKLIAITGLSTTAFIRSQRLKIAVQLLKSSDATIAEVAYASGFNTVSYFIKCFRELYGKTPSEFASK